MAEPVIPPSEIPTAISAEQHILLFDGVCNLCNGTVQFLIWADRRKKLRFASLQSEPGQQLLHHFRYSGPALQSVVFCKGDKLFTHSRAILEVFRLMGFPWSILFIFIIVPRPMRDFIYKWIAQNRYRWFGKKETCWLPTPELRQRFLS